MAMAMAMAMAKNHTTAQSRQPSAAVGVVTVRSAGLEVGVVIEIVRSG
jgi:hypothetical protein